MEHLGRSNFVVCTPLSDGLLFEGKAIVFESETQVEFAPGGRFTLTADPASLVLFKASDGTALEGDLDMGRKTVAPVTSTQGNLQRTGSQ